MDISLKYEEHIMDLCNCRNVDIYKMTKDSTDYNLIPKRYYKLKSILPAKTKYFYISFEI